MTHDELNVLRGIIKHHGEVKAGEEFGGVIALKRDPNAPRCGMDASLWCVFSSGDVHCPIRRVESRVVVACSTGSPDVKKELVFVPKVEYLTWKLTKA